MGIFFAFLFAFLEALPIIGTFIPGIALMSVVGYWVGANLISFHMALYIDGLVLVKERLLKDFELIFL